MLDYWIIARLEFMIPGWLKRILGLKDRELDLSVEIPGRSDMTAQRLLDAETFASVFWLLATCVSMAFFFAGLVLCRVTVEGSFLRSPWSLLPMTMAAAIAFSLVEYCISSLGAMMLSNYIDATRAAKKGRLSVPPPRAIPKAYDFWAGFTAVPRSVI
jgi:hypothetical protein